MPATHPQTPGSSHRLCCFLSEPRGTLVRFSQGYLRHEMPGHRTRRVTLGRGPGNRREAASQPGAGSRYRQGDLFPRAVLSSLYNIAPAKGGIERLRAHSRPGKAIEKGA